ncbi:MAG: hypothetical protein ABIZ09_20130 [Rhodoferax sp.]|jgi:hypothetical protein
MRFRNSFWALLGRNTAGAPDVVMNRVRQAMFLALDHYCDDDCSGINHRIDCAQHIDELWYLRPDLMDAIATRHQETTARDCIVQITLLFDGYQPGAHSPSHFATL